MQDLSLAGDFPEQDEARWRALAEAALKGAPFERLIGRTADAIAIAPLYRAPDFASAADGAGLPGQAPFTRGGAQVRDRHLPWDIRAAFRHADISQTNAEILADLAGGVSSIEVQIGARGVAIESAADLDRALDGVLLDVAPVALNAGARGIEVSRWLLERLAATKSPAAPAFNLDPATVWTLDGGLDMEFERALAQAAAFAHDAHACAPAGTSLRASGRPAHEAGGSEAQELALLLASGLASLRALEARGFSVETGARQILFTLSVGPDVLLEIAKLRAARMLWARVMEACGAAPEEQGMKLQAVTSRRMLTKHDPWTNILRGTAAAFAAAAGGADIVTVLPFTLPLGEASPMARRIARNTQLILMEESHLGRVADPAGGAWAAERLTQDLAEKAWALLQAIEVKGGLGPALRADWLQSEIAKLAQARARDVSRRKLNLTGVSDFPLLDGAPPPLTSSPARRRSAPRTRLDAISPLLWRRDAEPFEALRQTAEGAGRPHVFFANLGPLSEFSARSQFARNLFAAGGVDAIGPETPYTDHAAMAAAFKASGARVAVMCASDTRLAAESQTAAQILKAAGCDWLIHAGKPADEAAVRAKGFDQFIFAGADAIEQLKTLHAALGVAA